MYICSAVVYFQLSIPHTTTSVLCRIKLYMGQKNPKMEDVQVMVVQRLRQVGINFIAIDFDVNHLDFSSALTE